MSDFYLKVLIYLCSFALSLFGLNALDFNRLLKKNKVVQAQTLYFIIALSLAYLVGSLVINITYYFYK